jgi:hypothetical protein
MVGNWEVTRILSSFWESVDSHEMPIPGTDSGPSNNRHIKQPPERESHHRRLIDADSPASSTAAASLL